MTVPRCSVCDVHVFKRVASQAITERQWFDAETQDWDFKVLGEDMLDSEPWECANGHELDDETQEAVQDSAEG